MSRSPGARDNASQPTRSCGLGVFVEQIGSAMRRHDERFVSHSEIIELSCCVLHDIPIALAAHGDADERFFHEAGHKSAYSSAADVRRRPGNERARYGR